MAPGRAVGRGEARGDVGRSWGGEAPGGRPRGGWTDLGGRKPVGFRARGSKGPSGGGGRPTQLGSPRQPAVPRGRGRPWGRERPGPGERAGWEGSGGPAPALPAPGRSGRPWPAGRSQVGGPGGPHPRCPAALCARPAASSEAASRRAGPAGRIPPWPTWHLPCSQGPRTWQPVCGLRGLPWFPATQQRLC